MSGPLDRAGVTGVLRYWLAALRHEEALATRPRARRIAPGGPVKVDVAQPDDGHAYFKLPPDDDVLSLLWREEKSVERPLDAERAAACERWLAQAYRLEAYASRGDDSGEQQWIVGFPVVHFRRRGELAALLRFPVELGWFDDSNVRFTPPTYRQRKRGKVHSGPTNVRVQTTEDDEALLPYTLDRQLLSDTLGVNDEEVEDLLAVYEDELPSGPELVDAVVGLLTGGVAEKADFQQLVTAVRQRLVGSGASVYPVALVYDGNRVQATYHLQRELGLLLRKRIGDVPWDTGSALWSYVAGDPQSVGWGPVIAGAHPEPPTEDQRAVAERFAGSTLTSAQGPPGTGKTRLILELAGDALVRRAAGLLEKRTMGRDLLLVTSTNNRAVDHAIDPLTGGLPVGLRAGSQEVTKTRTVALLSQAKAWLRGHEEEGALERYDAALSAFGETWETHRTTVAPLHEARTREVRRDRVRRALDALPDARPTGQDHAELTEAAQGLRALDHRLERMTRIVERAGAGSIGRLHQVWKKTEAKAEALDTALETLDVPFALSLPPEADGTVEERAEAWSDALDEATGEVQAARAEVDGRRQLHRDAERRVELTEELERLSAALEVATEAPDVHAIECELLIRALAVRERWAEVHREPLLDALERALRAAAGRRSLKSLFSDDLDAGDWLRRLFPVMGCTLLSLGNALPAEAEIVDRVVIDEAGQCHPAYAAAALLRAKRALVVGDTNQLTPVSRLSEADDERVRAGADPGVELERLAAYRVAGQALGSAQALADAAVEHPLTLHDHFRCRPEIVAVCDALCDYGLRVLTPPRPPRGGWLTDPLLLAPVRGEQVRARGSWANDAEVEVTVGLLRAALQAGVAPHEVAVLTPYVGQLDRLRRALRQNGIPLSGPGADPADPGVTTGTVHRFQGGERPIVLFSTVVTRPRSLGFLNERVNLVNVAVSRAREHLVVVGDPPVLEAGRCTGLLVRRAVRMDPANLWRMPRHPNG